MGRFEVQADPPGLGKEDDGKLKRELRSVCPASWHQIIRVAFSISPEEFVREAVSRGHPRKSRVCGNNTGILAVTARAFWLPRVALA